MESWALHAKAHDLLSGKFAEPEQVSSIGDRERSDSPNAYIVRQDRKKLENDVQRLRTRIVMLTEEQDRTE